MRRLIFGVDPGASGGIAAHLGKDIYTRKLDDIESLCDWIRGMRYHFEEYKPVAYIENVPKYIGRDIPSSSSFTLGKSFGEVLGLFAALEIETFKITPQEWQKAIGAGKRGKKSHPEWKRHLKALAAALFPAVKVTLWNADALLLMEYGLLREVE